MNFDQNHNEQQPLDQLQNNNGLTQDGQNISNQGQNVVGPEFEDDDGFDYVEDSSNQNQLHQPNGVMGAASNAIGGEQMQDGGAFGAAMGMDNDNEDLMALEDELINAGAAGKPAIEEKINVSVFVNFDEDDGNEKNIDLNQLFKKEGDEKAYNITMQIQGHHIFKEMVVQALDLLNARLAQPEVRGRYRLDTNPDKFADNYSVYKANKKGEAKDDYPSFSLGTNVKNMNAERFSLSCFTSAFIEFVESSDENQAPAQRQGSVSDAQLGQIGQLNKEAHQSVTRNARVLDESKKEQMLPPQNGEGCCKCEIF